MRRTLADSTASLPTNSSADRSPSRRRLSVRARLLLRAFRGPRRNPRRGQFRPREGTLRTWRPARAPRRRTSHALRRRRTQQLTSDHPMEFIDAVEAIRRRCAAYLIYTRIDVTSSLLLRHHPSLPGHPPLDCLHRAPVAHPGRASSSVYDPNIFIVCDTSFVVLAGSCPPGLSPAYLRRAHPAVARIGRAGNSVPGAARS
jgi:hypothetical protein